MAATEPSASTLLGDRDVLIVDDDAEIRRMIAVVLKPTLARISEAASGTEAETKLRESTFDVVILDWNLADMPASDFLERAEHVRPGISDRCLVVTGDLIRNGALHEAERRGLLLLRKPFRPGELIAAVGRALHL